MQFCYKIIYKIIVKRLRLLLNIMIDESHVAFVPNRSIIENVVLTQEVVHNFKTTKRKKGWVGIKLDIMKAYDKMELSFLVVVKAFSLNKRFTNLMNQCFRTVHFTILLNGG